MIATLTTDELAEAVAHATGYKGSIAWDISKPDGTPKKQLDTSRLKAMGWESSIAFADGLAEVVKDYLYRLGKGNSYKQDTIFRQ